MNTINDKTLSELEAKFGHQNDAPFLHREPLRLNAYSLDDFLNLKLPPREMLLDPWLPKSGLCMIHAYRGIGKTFISLGIAVAVSRGVKFLIWDAPQPRGVLYIDGEMPASVLQNRLAQIISMHEHTSRPGVLRVITPDVQPDGIMPDLATPEGQAAVDQHITDDINLIIVDNLSCLVRSGKENEGNDWIPIQSWALKQRARGKSVLMVHHSGKSGLQRGCSKREDVLDTVLALERPCDYSPKDGARFIVKYEKSRGFFGDDAKPFEAWLTTGCDNKPSWSISAVENSTFDKVIAQYNAGTTQIDIANNLQIDKSNVSRHIKSGRERGLIKE